MTEKDPAETPATSTPAHRTAGPADRNDRSPALALMLDRLAHQLELLRQGQAAQQEILQQVLDAFLTGRPWHALQETVAADHAATETVAAALEDLQNGLRKIQRAQLKANSLLEIQVQQFIQSVQTLERLLGQEEALRREAQEQHLVGLEQARHEARLDVLAAFLPAVDSLERVLQSARRMLDRLQLPSQDTTPQASGWRERLTHLLAPPSRPAPEPSVPNSAEMRRAVASWIEGVELAHRRLLALLEQEQITPFGAPGERFDPYRHVAVEVEERPDLPEGLIVDVRRPGYRYRDQVLRYAEVVVARSTAGGAEQDSRPGPDPSGAPPVGPGRPGRA